MTGSSPALDVPTIRTQRLVLRGFTDEDVTSYHALFTDPEVTRYLPMQGSSLPVERIEQAIVRSREHWAARGYGIWAVADGATGALLGQCGLQFLEDVGETELLYALVREAWGRGLATEGSEASLRFGFDTAELGRIVAYAVAENTASTRVMEKVGMHREAGGIEIFGITCDRYAIARPTA